MTDSPLPRSDAASRFFDNYLAALHRLRIPEKQRRWYVKHVEDFIRAQNGRKIKTLSGAEVGAYLDVLGRRPGLRGWQFGQRVDAIRILFCGLGGAPVGGLGVLTEFVQGRRLSKCLSARSWIPAFAGMTASREAVK